MWRDVTNRLRARAREAVTRPQLWGDVVYGLGLLRETASAVIAPNGRLELLQDLQRRALAVEATHALAVLQDLLAALEAFLNEELDEALAAMNPSTGKEPMMTEWQKRQQRAEADRYQRYGTRGQAAESERAELARRRQVAAGIALRERAVKAIATHRLTPYVKPEELMGFAETKWSTLLAQWNQSTAAAPQTDAADLFTRHLESNHPLPTAGSAGELFSRMLESTGRYSACTV